MTGELANRYDLIIFDLDGVVYVGSRAVAPAPATVARLGLGGVEVAFATNNASRRAAEVAALLNSLDVPATGDQVLTSAAAAASYLAGEYPAGTPVLVVGALALREEIAAVGLTPVASAEADPQVVVQGFGPQVGWAELAEACVAVRAGAPWVATNSDPTLPTERGALPGNGALIAALATALGRGPDLVVGKPEPTLFQQAVRRFEAEAALVVGDRLDTDIEGAIRAGLDSLLVLTGVTDALAVITAPAQHRPTYLARDLDALSQPEATLGFPSWQNGPGEARAGRFRAWVEHDRLCFDGAGEPVQALRALAAAAWANPSCAGIDARGGPARAAMAELSLPDRLPPTRRA